MGRREKCFSGLLAPFENDLHQRDINQGPKKKKKKCIRHQCMCDEIELEECALSLFSSSLNQPCGWTHSPCKSECELGHAFDFSSKQGPRHKVCLALPYCLMKKGSKRDVQKPMCRFSMWTIK